MYTLRELRQEVSDQQIKDILLQFNVEPHYESDAFIIFPTCCHNLEGGSPKLYYYKNTKLFKCYTDCNELFDIFTLLMKMYALRGKEITLQQAISLCDLDGSIVPNSDLAEIMQDYKYMQELSGSMITTTEQLNFKILDKKILNNFTFDYNGIKPWIQEGINLQELQRFNIRFDAAKNCIIIPNFDIKGELIGVRGRFLDPDAKAKYSPIWLKGECLSHPTSKTFYGIYENQEAIRKKQMAIIFEGEKSVMKFGTYYGSENNIALATLGQNISKEQIQLLLDLDVRYVVLAYDADYETYDELHEKEAQYKKIAKILTPYFNVSILIDYDLELPFKDSPVDMGKEVFERLLREKINL